MPLCSVPAMGCPPIILPGRPDSMPLTLPTSVMTVVSPNAAYTSSTVFFTSDSGVHTTTASQPAKSEYERAADVIMPEESAYSTVSGLRLMPTTSQLRDSEIAMEPPISPSPIMPILPFFSIR